MFKGGRKSSSKSLTPPQSPITPGGGKPRLSAFGGDSSFLRSQLERAQDDLADRDSYIQKLEDELRRIASLRGRTSSGTEEDGSIQLLIDLQGDTASSTGGSIKGDNDSSLRVLSRTTSQVSDNGSSVSSSISQPHQRHSHGSSRTSTESNRSSLMGEVGHGLFKGGKTILKGGKKGVTSVAQITNKVTKTAIDTTKTVAIIGTKTAIGTTKQVAKMGKKGARKLTSSKSSKSSKSKSSSRAASRWDESLEIISELLEEDSETCKNMTPYQKQKLANVKKLLLEGVQSHDKAELQHIPKSLTRRVERSRGNGSQSLNYIMKEFGGVNNNRRSLNSNRAAVREELRLETTGKLHSIIDSAALKDLADEEEWDIYVPPEFRDLKQEQQEKLFRLLSWSQLDRWDYPIFELADLVPGNPLLFMGWAVLGSPHSQYAMAKVCGIPLEETQGYNFKESSLKIPQDTLCDYLRAIEQDYNSDNAYHNEIHGADVLQTLHTMLQMVHGVIPTTTEELFAILLAAAVHDVNHPGENNAFQMNSKSNLALMYNDISILENMHASHAFMKMLGHGTNGNMKGSIIDLASNSQLNVLKNAEPEQFTLIRSRMVEAVLHTDMSKHFHAVSAMKSLILTHNGDLTNLNEDDASEYIWKIMLYMLHMADISNPAKPDPLFQLWTDRCLEEFFAQGDLESDLGLPISPNCDRKTTKRPDSQIGFISFVIKPAYEVLASAIPEIGSLVLPIIESNLEYWREAKQLASAELSLEEKSIDSIVGSEEDYDNSTNSMDLGESTATLASVEESITGRSEEDEGYTHNDDHSLMLEQSSGNLNLTDLNDTI